jgi:hypothetical protein
VLSNLKTLLETGRPLAQARWTTPPGADRGFLSYPAAKMDA